MTAVSCTIETYDWENDRNWNNLKSYTDNIFVQFSVLPARDLVSLLDVNDYMQLSEEEQSSPEWADVRSKIQHYSETLLRIPSLGMNVDTRGVSLSDPGNYWLIDVYEQNAHNNLRWYDYYFYDHYTSAIGHGTSKRVTCVWETGYEITDEKNDEVMKFSAIAVPSAEGGYDLYGNCIGRILPNEKGLSSTFNITEFLYKKYSGYSTSFDGEKIPMVEYQMDKACVRVATYQGETLLDWCGLVHDTSKDPTDTYTSNMEVYDIPHTFPLE